MTALFTGFMQIFHDADTRKKILFTICMLGLYRFLIQIPLPFVNIDVLLAGTNTATD
jgi:preprotein translocase subunit SecY